MGGVIIIICGRGVDLGSGRSSTAFAAEEARGGWNSGGLVVPAGSGAFSSVHVCLFLGDRVVVVLISLCLFVMS